ncbi:MAG: glycosyltransferase family 4 protein [Opitutae bacterium]|nr:glycosyltransferase family 4 protein [Opitutae bacterium]
MSAASPRVIFLNRVCWPSTAATAQLLTDLAEGLAARGREVHVIAAGEGPARHNGVTIHRSGGSGQHGGLLSRAVNYGRYRRAAQRQLAALLHPGDVVVAMTDPPMLGTAIMAVAAARGAKVIHWIQDIYPEIVTAHFGAWLAPPLWPLRARRDRAWQAAARCVTLGEDMAQMAAASGVPSERVTVVPNWAPRELHVPAPAEAVAARRAGWDVTGKFVVAYSGNLGRVHEFTAVLDAAEKLQSQRDIVFLFIGAGARFEQVRHAAKSRGLDNVRLLPPVPREHLASALAAADAHLVTLKPDFARLVYPSKLAGVLAAGRPGLFVGPVDGEIARLLVKEDCGAAFAATDGAGLAATVARWQADPPLCQHLGRQARAAYEGHFTFEAALAHWEEILRQSAG